MSAAIRTDVTSRDLTDKILAPVRHALRDLENTLGLEAVDEQGDVYGIESAEASAGTSSQLVEAGQQPQGSTRRQRLPEHSGNGASLAQESAEISKPALMAESAEVATPAPMAASAEISNPAPMAESAKIATPAPMAESATISKPAPTSAANTIPVMTARTQSEPQNTSLSREHPTIADSTGQESGSGQFGPAVATIRADTDSAADASVTRVAAQPRQHATGRMERPATITVRRPASTAPTSSVSATDALSPSHKTPPRAWEAAHPRAESIPAMNQTPALHAQSLPAPDAASRPGPGGLDREHLEQTLAEILREAARRDGVDVP